MDYPKVEAHQIIVMHCEVRTGIVTFANGNWHLGIGNPYLVFDSFETACEYCETIVSQHQEMECWIIDSGHNQLKRVISSKYGKG